VIDPTVRLARADDTGQLVGIEAESRASVADMRGGLRWLETNPSIDWPARIAADEVVVAHIDDVVVGLLVFAIDGGVAHVELVYVVEAARELGFGDALVERAIELMRAGSATAIEGEALPGDRLTKNLYERAGITARLIVLARQI